MGHRIALALLPTAALLAACSAGHDQKAQPAASGPAAVDTALLTSGGDGSDWPAIGRTYHEQRFSPLTAINDGNVGKLGIAWYADLPDQRGQEATPVVVDGVIYLSQAWSKVAAFDAVTGKQLWAFDPQVPKDRLVHTCCDAVNRGVAVWKGKVYVGTLDGRLIALDARNGSQLWSTQTFDTSRPYAITGAPRVVKDMVIIGNGGAEFGVRGYVTAYDAETGKQKWRFYTVPSADGKPDNAPSDKPLAKVRDSWSQNGEWKKTGGGGTVWDAIVYDPELDLLYLGVGNGSPWNHGLRSEGKGDNLFLSSIVALKPETGEYVWHYQETPAESWDFTATQPIILADMKIGGQDRKVLLHAPKNGFFFVIDRSNGKFISATPFIKGINWATGYDPATGRPIENPEARYYRTGKMFVSIPGAMGAHSWHPMSFSPKTGLVYIPANEAGLPYAPPAAPSDKDIKKRGFNVGVNWGNGALPRDVNVIKATIAATRGALIAWDPVNKREAWRVQYGTPWNGGTLATAGNLVFQGTAVGQFQAFRADNGQKLWSMPVQSGVLSAPSTFAVKGEQYVAFTTSRGGVYALAPGAVAGAYNRLPAISRLVVLKLGGNAQLPPAPPTEVTPLDPPKSTGTQAQIKDGHDLYARNCSVCHGDSATSGGVNPDLRHSGILGDANSWKAVVHDGLLKDNGMVAFANTLSPEQIENIRLFVIDQANWDKANAYSVKDAVGDEAGSR